MRQRLRGSLMAWPGMIQIRRCSCCCAVSDFYKCPLCSVLQGSIVLPRGPHNFGWDPIFQPEGFDTTYAEMDSSIKNTISHRYRALAALREHFAGQGGKNGISEGDAEGPPESKRPRTVDTEAKEQ